MSDVVVVVICLSYQSCRKPQNEHMFFGVVCKISNDKIWFVIVSFLFKHAAFLILMNSSLFLLQWLVCGVFFPSYTCFNWNAGMQVGYYP